MPWKMVEQNWLVVKPTPLKNMSSSLGMIEFPIYRNIKCMFHITNQLWLMIYIYICSKHEIWDLLDLYHDHLTSCYIITYECFCSAAKQTSLVRIDPTWSIIKVGRALSISFAIKKSGNAHAMKQLSRDIYWKKTSTAREKKTQLPVLRNKLW